MSPSLHQYIDRESEQVQTERFYGDRIVNFLYSSVRERAPFLFKALTSATTSHLVGFWNYDTPLSAKISGASSFAKRLGVDLSECLDDPMFFDTARKVFERKIRYWETRTLEADPRTVVSPADSKVLIGSLEKTSQLFLKGKFFDFHELLGIDKEEWHYVFYRGDFAIFRLTPEQYHYNHTPVAGRVVDFYEVDGTYHSCNPGSSIFVATPYSKNKRVVTVIDTDVPGGTGIGYVAMIEIVALMKIRRPTGNQERDVSQKGVSKKSLSAREFHRCPVFSKRPNSAFPGFAQQSNSPGCHKPLFPWFGEACC